MSNFLKDLDRQTPNSPFLKQIRMKDFRFEDNDPPYFEPSLYSMKTTVKILEYDFGYKTLFRILRDCDILDEYSMPHQRYIDERYFTQEYNIMQKGYRHLQTYVLGQRGLEFVKRIVDEYLSKNPVPKGKRRKKNGGDSFILIDDSNN